MTVGGFMNRSKWFLSAFLLVLIAAPTRSDDTAFGGFGDTVFPVRSTNVRMDSEKVHLWQRRFKVRVECEFVFINDGPEERLQVGFPAEPGLKFGDQQRGFLNVGVVARTPRDGGQGRIGAEPF